MKILIFTIVFCIFSSIYSLPAGNQPEVELVTPTNTNKNNEKGVGHDIGDIPFIVIRRQGNPFGGFGGLGFNPFFPFGLPRNNRPNNRPFPPPVQDDTEENIGSETIPSGDIDKFLKNFFAPRKHNNNNNNDDEENKAADSHSGSDSGKKGCAGFMCVLFDFEKHINQIQKEIDAVKKKQEDKQNEIPDNKENKNDTSDDGYDINNSTYTEKVLDDGTVVRINKTVIADTNDDGSQFFFHSTFHNINTNTNNNNNNKNSSDVPFPNDTTVKDLAEIDQNKNDEKTTKRQSEGAEDSGSTNIDDGLLVGST